MRMFRLNKFLILAMSIVMVSFIPPGKKKKRSASKTVEAVKLKASVKDSIENRYYIIIDKSDYELKVYDDEGWYATYPVVFGNNSLDDKKMEGDKNTPEGKFRILSKRSVLGMDMLYPGKLTIII